jgi:hypothetical protein
VTAREEAISAIEVAMKILTDNEPVAGLRQRLLVTTLEHAQASVLKIEELKRARRARKEVAVLDHPGTLLQGTDPNLTWDQSPIIDSPPKKRTPHV